MFKNKFKYGCINIVCKININLLLKYVFSQAFHVSKDFEEQKQPITETNVHKKALTNLGQHDLFVVMS